MEEVVRLVSSGDCVKIWDSVSMTTCEQFLPHSATHPVSQVCWSSNNQYLVSASSVGDKLVVSSLKASPVPVIELAEGKRQTRVCLSSSSQYLLSGGLDHTVNLWDLKSRRLHRSLQDHKEEVTCVSFNTNDTCVASGSTSGDLILHSLTTNLSSKPFGHGANQPIHDLRLCPLKRSLLGSVSDGGTVALWDSNTQKELHVFDGAHKAPGSGLAFSPASDLLFISAGLDKKIICYDTASKIILRVIRVEAPLTAVDFSPDGLGVVVGSTQGKIYHYDLRNPSTPTRVTPAHKTSVTCLRYQSSSSKQPKSSKGPGNKRISSKLQSGLSDSAPRHGSAHHSSAPHGGNKMEQNTGQFRLPVLTSGGECVEGQSAPLSALGKFNNSVGRNSLDMFSPAREDSRPLRTSGDALVAKGNATGCEMFPRDGEPQQIRGRSSLDVFSPVRDGKTTGSRPALTLEPQEQGLSVPDPSSGLPPRKTPLGTPGNRCFSPLSFFKTPPPIREEETPPSPGQQNNNNSSSPEAGQAMPMTSLPTSQNQPAPPFCTPEPSLRRANGLQALLGAGSSHNAATPTTAPGAAAAELSSSVAAQLEGVCAQGGAPLSALQTHFIQNMIHDTLEEFRDTCHRDIVNLQVEMIRQFYIQLKEIHGLIEKYSLNDSLLEEIQKLREENRKHFNY
ncbi:unnamed protein product [Lota lota]